MHRCCARALVHDSRERLCERVARVWLFDAAGTGGAHLQLRRILGAHAAGLVYVERKPAAYPVVADARLLQEEAIRQTHAYLAELTDEELNTNTELRFPDGDMAVRTPALVLHHMLTHAFHHKGQIATMCRVLGHPAGDTDMNQFE